VSAPGWCGVPDIANISGSSEAGFGEIMHLFRWVLFDGLLARA
jgi:hypothetical protein